MQVLASSETSPYAAVVFSGAPQYGVQFHPEVTHTEKGQEMLTNFVFGVCRAEKNWSMEGFLQKSVEELSAAAGAGALCRLGRRRLLGHGSPSVQGDRGTTHMRFH